MLINLPNELLYFIVDLVIEPYNNFYFIINLLSKKITINKNYKNIREKKIICYYCKLVFDNIIIIKNGGYCSMKNLPLCSMHYYICRYCNKRHDFYEHSFLNDSCINCK